ncbi:hypothetical protein P4G69_01230 [Bacillus cereus]|nr:MULTISPECIES: hypothetical protein [Bacillus]MEB8550611.1 hypothetical protein [Bacillus cereus]MEB8723633.1 hypothetical protein [Bacillus cereus]MED1059723.1 hypothetical protein [Bacillus mycoides]
MGTQKGGKPSGFQLAAYIAVLKRIGAMKNEEEVKNVVSEEITAGDG